MQYRKLGRTGLKVSVLCLGTMTFGWSADEKTSFAIMDAAFEAGINFFDTADVYSRWIEGNTGGESETIIGKWLKGKPRREIVIATKVRNRMWEGPNGEGLSRAHIMTAVEDSLRRLQTDYIDLYQTHWPDMDTPLEETLYALDTLVQQGKVRYIGASNYPAWYLTKSLWVSDVNRISRFECLQPHYSLLHRDEFERELMPLCRDQQIGVIPYSPLAAGFLSGKYTRDNRQPDSTRSGGLIQRLVNDEDAYTVLDEVTRIAAARGVPVPQIALAWLLANDVITAPIIGARTVEQLQAALGAETVQLTPEEVEALNRVSQKY
ncbi:MAG: aldo/keto reductase [Chloroflexota bacterium]|nr:MAG: aldo/keto reductase [Chloroflexota bacterium]